MTSIWRLQLRPGSFRGVKFNIDSHDFESGRRIVDHLFPYKDDPFTEDLGRKQRVYRLNTYVVGTDYFPQRDALIEALEKNGPGILVHPYLGTKTVEAADFTVSESQSEGGLVKITVTFRETTRLANPTGVIDRLSDAKDKANAVQAALQRAFGSFNSPSPTTFIFQSASRMLDSVSDLLSSATSAIPGGQANTISELTYSIRNLKGNSRALLQRPGQLSASIVSATKGLTEAMNIDGLFPEDSNGRPIIDRLAAAALGNQKRGAFLGILQLPDLLEPTYQTTDSRKLEASNQNLMRQLVLGSAISELVVVSTATDYETFDEAIYQRDFIISQIDLLLNDDTLPDEVYSALQDLSATTIENIPDPEGNAPRLNKIEIKAVTPSLVLAYELYGNLSLESDIIVRNQISNPAFISPLKTLEVIAGD